MLESLVASILNRTLGHYVEDFDPAQLNIGIWSGDVKLRDLKLKQESLDRLGLPIALKFGHLGQLTLQIPWSNLKSKPVKVIIEDMFLLTSAKLPTDINVDEEEERQLRVKKRKLEDLELTQSVVLASESEEDREKNENFMESLTTKIVDNLQITIKNIHLRYEDQDTFTKEPYAIGLTLQELSAVSTDENWIPGFIMGVSDLSRKLTTLKSLEIYWETDAQSLYDIDRQKMVDSFLSMIDRNSSLEGEGIQHLMKPVSGYGHLIVNKAGSTESDPHYNVELFFDEFGVTLDEEQYRDMCWTLSEVSWYRKTYKFRRLRPHVSVAEDPKQWLKYAFKCVFDEIHERNYKWTWEYFKERRDQRKEYVELWLKHLEGDPDAEIQTRIDNLESIVAYNDLKFYRELATIKYVKEHHAHPTYNTAQNGKPQAASTGTVSSWVSWWRGDTAKKEDSSSGDTEEDNEAADLTLSSQQRKELYDAIGYDEQRKLTDSLDMPRERVKTSIGWNLKKGSFVIKKAQTHKSIAEIIFEGMHADVFQRKDSYYLGFKLREFRVENGSSGTLYKHIVSVKPFDTNNTESSSSSETDTDGDLDQQEAFFQISYESNPLDESADSELLAKMNSMTIFHDPRFIEDVARFFRPPKTHTDTIGAIMNAAESTIQDFTEQTRIGLQYAFDEHKTLNCKMDLQAPLIIVPLDCTSWSSPVCVLDAGHINIKSDLVDKDKIKEIKDADKSSYGQNDWEKMEAFLFDKFELQLEDAQMLIGPNVKAAIEQLHSEGPKPSLILDHLTINILLELSIVPSYTHLPLMKISGNIPQIKACLNDYQHRIFTQALLKMMPDISAALAVTEETSNDLERLVSNEDTSSGYGSGLSSATTESSENSDTTTDSEQKRKDIQHKLDVNINIGVIMLTLSRCSDPKTFEAEKLADVVGDNFRLKYFSTSETMNANVELADFSVYDFMEPTGNEEFKKLISADISSAESKAQNLLSVVYIRRQRNVQFNNKIIEAFDQDVKLSISDFKVVITRKSVLTLINFFRNTFVDPNAPLLPADQLRHNDETNAQTAPEQIQLKMEMNGATLILNDDGYKIGTMRLKEADIDMVLFPDKMKLDTSIGGFSLRDDISKSIPSLSQLIRIRGSELIKLHYETFDPTTNKLPYSSELSLETGSIVITFVQSSFARIYSFISQFSRMKDIYDNAREAALSQATNIEGTDKMKFNILLRAPILIFPKVRNPAKVEIDTVKANLGELEASNSFTESGGSTFNVTTAKLKNTRISSTFSLSDGGHQDLEIIDKFDVQVNANYYDGSVLSRPATIIKAMISGSDMKLTDWQAHYILEIAQSIPQAFTDYSIGNETIQDLQDDALQANMIISKDGSPSRVVLDDTLGSQKSDGPSANETLNADAGPKDMVKMSVYLEVPALSLTIYNNTKRSLTLENKGLSKFMVNDLCMKADICENGSYDAEIKLKSFVVKDVRNNTKNKFPDIIPASVNDKYQLVASVRGTEMEGKNSTKVDIQINNPTFLLAMDYLISLKTFADTVLDTTETTKDLDNKLQTIEENSTYRQKSVENEEDEESEITGRTLEATEQNELSYVVRIPNISIILLANSEKSDSEAVVFKISQILLSATDITRVQLNGIGMFLCNMESYEVNRIQIIDDFSSKFEIDGRGSSPTSYLTHMTFNVDPLLIRVSLSDIKLATEIFNRATEIYSEATRAASTPTEARRSRRSSIASEIGQTIARHAPSVLSSLTKISSKASSKQKPHIIIKAEKFLATMGGVRIVLIGDVHELPVLDVVIKPFKAQVKNWSTDLVADATVQPQIQIYNYSTSSWEPLLDQWSFSVHVAKDSKVNGQLTLNVSSHDIAEVTLTRRSIASLAYFGSLLKEKSEIRPRGEGAPYLLFNQTGYDLNVWIDSGKSDLRNREQLTLLKNGDHIPWAFEDWREIRKNLNTQTARDTLGVEFLDSEFDPVRSISLTTEGEDVFTLEPKHKNTYHHRLACEVVLAKDKVKHVILKSTITIHNHTSQGLFIGVGIYSKNPVVDREVHIPSGGKIALPIDYVYEGKLSVRPETTGQQFGWSTAHSKKTNKSFSFDWKTISNCDMILECPSIESGNVKSYYFNAKATYNSTEVLTKIYPHMIINITPPLVLQNLLPFDVKWELFQKGAEKWECDLKEGSSCSIHVINLSKSAVMKVSIPGTTFGKSRPAIINSSSKDVKNDETVLLINTDHQKVYLKLLYINSPDAGKKVTLYTPYLIVNRTGKTVLLSNGSSFMVSRAKRITSGSGTAMPDLFSFGESSRGLFTSNFETDRVSLKIKDSLLSRRFNIDKVGQNFQIEAPMDGKPLEYDVGVHISEGRGIFNLTKVVTLTPRYIVKNSLSETVYIVSVGSSRRLRLDPGSIAPIYGVSKVNSKQICISTESNGKLSAPFNINDVGEVFVRAQKRDSLAHILIKMVITTEDASIFITMMDSNGNWPYSIRNFSDFEFIIYQADPYMRPDGTRRSDMRFKPILYRIPPKSSMPYAWDFPAAEVKELVLRNRNKERFVQLAEIGTLYPMKLGSSPNSPNSSVVDLNVQAEGPVQLLIITNYDPKTSMYQMKSNSSTHTTNNRSSGEFETGIKKENYSMSVSVNFKGMGISLINSECEEINYLSLRGAGLDYSASEIHQNLTLKLKWLQIDNQMYPTTFPVLLYPTVVPKSEKEMDKHPVFSVGISKMNDDTHGVTYIKFATALLQEMSIELDEPTISSLMEFFKTPSMTANEETIDELWDKNIEIPEPPALRTDNDYYFELLHLQPLKFNVSFEQTDELDENAPISGNPISLAVSAIGMAMGNIREAPIQLTSLILENVRTPLPYLQQNIVEHYKQAFLYQWYKVLGSADVIGNPVGLFNNISSGVMDIFYEPYQGYIMTDRPQELGIGLARGGISFLRKSLFGVSDSVSRFTSSVAKGLTVASMDRDFQKKRRENRQKGRPNHAFGGFASGTNSLIGGLSSGFSGLAMEPIRGANEEGASGFFKGLGRGIVGLPTKAATGVLDFTNNISESIKSSTTAYDKDSSRRIRLPRNVRYNGCVTSYSEREAQGQYWLKTCDGGKYSHERYLAHVMLPGTEMVCIISMSRILVVTIETLKAEWNMPYERIGNITLENTGILIKQNRRGFLERFISIPEKADQNFLYRNIVTAVNEYNKKCIVSL